MSTIQRAVQFANPVTGEVLTLDSPDQDLGAYLSAVREYKSVLNEHLRIVQDELLARMDHQAKWTMNRPGIKLTGQSPRQEESWSGADLRGALLELHDEGVLSIEAVDGAVETVVSYKVKKAGVNSLRALGGRVAEVIESLVSRTDKDRYVSVISR